jgi:alginate O-acetyltransferase complex protein AlgI
MLFNSYVFIFGFLPLTLAVFYVAAAVRAEYARWWLAAASLYFYGYWNISFLPLLIASIAFNYSAGRIIASLRLARPTWCTPALIAAVSLNLCLLGFFKYATFAQNTFWQLTGAPGPLVVATPIPLGISFFTFTQIAYLADVTYVDRAERNPISYALFVNFFPHLIAGPILHHRATIPQFSFAGAGRLATQNLVIGIAIFSFGLFKKVVLADGVEPYVALAFKTDQTIPQLLDAWTGTLAYTVQIYFDFSGYCDMAIGLARMFGVVFPLNFNSPYQATSIIDFWRRWHMTLSRFLRDYVYIPLGGNRSGAGQYANILITMFLGGLWHGAGWTFIIWGSLHGFYLVANHEWRRLRGQRSSHPVCGWRAGVSRGVTFLAVVVAWVFFRADGLGQAGTILSAMIGGYGAGSAGELVCTSTSQTSCLFGIPAAWYWIAALLSIAFFAPNTQQVMWLWKPTLDDIPIIQAPSRLWFVPTLRWALATGVLFAVAIARLNEHSQFLYYQF